MADTDVDIDALRAHRFPGGARTIDHWENWLLTDCTRRGPMTEGLLHPVTLFHLPLAAAGTSVAELLALGGGGAPGSVTLLGYDWEYLGQLREGVEYSGSGGVAAAERVYGEGGEVAFDDVAFTIELHDPAGVCSARVTNRWRFRRSTAPHQPAAHIGHGEPLPPLVVADVGVDRMKTMAALLRDPYPIHWDPAAVRAAGYGDRPVNQGPLNLGYVANMLMAWAGDGAIRRLTVAFHGRVFAGDTVVAAGTVDGVAGGAAHDVVEVEGEHRRHCSVWLDRGADRLLSGTAEVAIPA